MIKVFSIVVLLVGSGIHSLPVGAQSAELLKALIQYQTLYTQRKYAEAVPFAAPDDEHGVAIQPETGLAVVHFGATTPDTGGLCDRNTAHVSEVVHGEQKWICQQFIYSHPLPDYSGIGPSDRPERDAAAPDMTDVL